MTKHPMQPLIVKDGVVRFKANAIVRSLLNWASARGMDLNEIARMVFSQEDRTQFAQLIGYSVSGYHELSYVSDEDALAASALAREMGLSTGMVVGCREGGCAIHRGVEKESDTRDNEFIGKQLDRAGKDGEILVSDGKGWVRWETPEKEPATDEEIEAACQRLKAWMAKGAAEKEPEPDRSG